MRLDWWIWCSSRQIILIRRLPRPCLRSFRLPFSGQCQQTLDTGTRRSLMNDTQLSIRETAQCNLKEKSVLGLNKYSVNATRVPTERNTTPNTHYTHRLIAEIPVVTKTTVKCLVSTLPGPLCIVCILLTVSALQSLYSFAATPTRLSKCQRFGPAQSGERAAQNRSAENCFFCKNRTSDEFIFLLLAYVCRYFKKNYQTLAISCHLYVSKMQFSDLASHTLPFFLENIMCSSAFTSCVSELPARSCGRAKGGYDSPQNRPTISFVPEPSVCHLCSHFVCCDIQCVSD